MFMGMHHKRLIESLLKLALFVLGVREQELCRRLLLLNKIIHVSVSMRILSSADLSKSCALLSSWQNISQIIKLPTLVVSYKINHLTHVTRRAYKAGQGGRHLGLRYTFYGQRIRSRLEGRGQLNATHIQSILWPKE